MKKIILREGWLLKRFPAGTEYRPEELEAAFRAPGSGKDRSFSVRDFPEQVHDVLLDYGMIENPNETGINRDLWIDEYDWVYRRYVCGSGGISLSHFGGNRYLCFGLFKWNVSWHMLRCISGLPVSGGRSEGGRKCAAYLVPVCKGKSEWGQASKTV